MSDEDDLVAVENAGAFDARESLAEQRRPGVVRAGEAAARERDGGGGRRRHARALLSGGTA